MTATRSHRAAVYGRPFFWIALAAIVAIVAAAWYLARPVARRNVLVITIDTWRADALTAEEMPAAMRLAARGMNFRRARAPAPLTLPSHTTLLGGVEPPTHGVRDNTAAPLPGPADRSYPLLAEEYRDAGYATAAFVASAVLDPRYRLDQGFSEYRHPPAPEPGSPTIRFLQAPEQVERFRAWMATRPQDRPFFAWVHLWDPHAPYLPYAGDAAGRRGTVEADPAEERYLGEVRRADAALEQLLELVDPETTIVVLTSDHGEALGEHGETSHGFLCHGVTMDIPLVLAGPGIPTGASERPCGLADVAPTLRRLCRLDDRPTDGRDLLDRAEERVVCGESLYGYRLYGWAQQSVAFDGRFSLIDGGPRIGLYDRQVDPAETSPLPAPTGHPAYQRLDEALIAYRDRRGPAGSEEAVPAPIPYGIPTILRSDFLPVAENRTLRDVAEALPDARLLETVAGAIAARNPGLVRGLLPRLRALEAADPGNPAPALARGRALLNVLRQPAEAAEAIEEAMRRGYRTDDLLRLLERAYRESGDDEAADRVRNRKKG